LTFVAGGWLVGWRFGMLALDIKLKLKHEGDSGKTIEIRSLSVQDRMN